MLQIHYIIDTGLCENRRECSKYANTEEEEKQSASAIHCITTQ